MGKITLSDAANGNWSPEDIAYITAIHWEGKEDGILYLHAMAQPRAGKSGIWPKADGPWYQIEMKFEGVRNFKVSALNSEYRQVMGFNIIDVKNRGLEGINYHIEDYENGIIEFYAKSAELILVARKE